MKTLDHCKKKIVIINQAANYLTIGYANAFCKKYDKVVLITGSLHIQGENLNKNIDVIKIVKWRESPLLNKLISYVIGSLQIYFLLLIRYKDFEVFYISLPPWNYIINLLLPNNFSMMIWDVYPDVLKVKGINEKNLLYRIWSYFNKKSFVKARKIFTIGCSTYELLCNYGESSKLKIIPIWPIFRSVEKIPRENNLFLKKYNLEDKFIVQYSGNIGLTHNVECLLRIAEKMKANSNILFQIIGRGPKLNHIKNLVNLKSLPNCQFLDFQSDEIFPHSLSAANVGVVILDERVSKGSVPSKSYNLMSLGIPSLYIASHSSELFEYAERFQNGKCFSCNEPNKAVEFIGELYSDRIKYSYYSQNSLKASLNFSRNHADILVDSLLN